jgi:pimeloyl-ACP methyl ester carboxylesterase
MLVLAALLLSSPAPGLLLAPCGPDLPGAQCGSLKVFENRSLGSGRTIDLKVVVVKARGPNPLPDPVFVLAGGPGEAATQEAGGAAQEFAPLLARRDFVFVDQRGTGGSHLLQCPLYAAGDPQNALGDFFPPKAIATCRAELEKDADLTQYTTSAAMADLDDVRAALSYDRINLYGGSYGTRAALVYLREHGDHVRTATLHGVSPTADPVPLRFPTDAQRALDGVLGECAAEPACRGAFPDLAAESKAVFARLEKAPAPAKILDPESGEARAVTLSHDLAAEAVRYLMYQAGTAGLVPVLLHSAAGGDFDALAEFALFGRQHIVDSGTGLYLSITCAEDLPLVPEGEAERAARGTFLGDYRYVQQKRACSLWPQARIGAGFEALVRSNVPVLLLSGQWDPVTPPARGEEALAGLPEGRHVVVPHGGHSYDGLEGTECVDRLVVDFVERGTTKGLDASCIASIKRRPFPTSPPPTKVVALPGADLDRLAGRYVAEGEPLEVKVVRDGARLRAELTGGTRLLLAPVSSTRFRVAGDLGTYAVFQVEDRRAVRLQIEENGQTTMTLKAAAR